jgi:predicted dehydrogenase
MNPVCFTIVGSGWRSEFFLRIARALPERFCVSGMLIRNSEKAARFAATWQVPVFGTLDELKKAGAEFTVPCVSWASMPVLIRETNELGIHALAETPPAPDMDGLASLFKTDLRKAKVQVAEQYFFQPFHAARLNVIATGKLGPVSHVQISVAHGYHGVSLMRKYLGLRFERATITAVKFSSPIVAGPGRSGPPAKEKIDRSEQVVACLDFGDRSAVFDFTGDQYFSWIRSQRVLVRGERGEIKDKEVRYLRAFDKPIVTQLLRQNAGEEGNLEGYYHKGIIFEGEEIYTNPFVPAPFSDDEIAVATCLQKMHDYVQGGSEFYSLADAAQDHYLGMMIDKAAGSSQPVVSEPQPWV